MLLDMVRNHEGEWSQEKLIAEFSIRQGYTRQRVREYLYELSDAGKIQIGELGVYLVEQDKKEEVKAEK